MSQDINKVECTDEITEDCYCYACVNGEFRRVKVRDLLALAKCNIEEITTRERVDKTVVDRHVFSHDGIDRSVGTILLKEDPTAIWVIYEDTAYYSNGWIQSTTAKKPYIGNPALNPLTASESEDNGMPFHIMVEQEDRVRSYFADKNGHILSIIYGVPTLLIKDECIRDTIARTQDIILTAEGIQKALGYVPEKQLDWRYRTGEQPSYKLDNKYLDFDWLPTRRGTVLGEERTIPAMDGNIYHSDAEFKELTRDMLKVGQKLLVSLDGVPYYVEVKPQSDGVTPSYAGNRSITDDTQPDTGEPFELVFLSNKAIFMSLGTHSVGIYDAEVIPMPEEFLPESVPVVKSELKTWDLIMYDGTGFVGISKEKAETAGSVSAVLYEKQTLTETQKAQARENIGTASHEQLKELSEKKADKSYVVSVFEQLKQLIQTGDIESAVAVLDEAILDLATLA